MNYDIDLFIRIINFIVENGGDAELYLELQGSIYVDFSCYKDFIDAIITVGDNTLDNMSPLEMESNTKIFKNIVDFLDNLIIDGKSLRARWNEVEYISDDCGTIDYTKEPEEQFLVENGQIWYTPKK